MVVDHHEKKIIHIGLTGGIATGKSTVAKMFQGKGAKLINLDKIAHEVMEPNTSAWKKIIATFGERILLPDNTVDRIKLGKIVFSDPEKLRKLEKIIHPAVLERWREKVARISKEAPGSIIISEVPLLFEKNLHCSFDATILVYAPPSVQIKRLIDRDSITPDEANRRLQAQIPIDEKLSLATWIIYNDSTLEKTRKQVDSLWNKLLELSK